MRTYIFTERERAILKNWMVQGERKETLGMILHRIRTFRDLESDVDLYLQVRDRLKQSSSSR